MTTPFDPAQSLLIDDFDTFVRYLAAKPALPLTGAGDLKAVDLWAINGRVNYVAPGWVTVRSRQADYPLLGFLAQIAIASRLFVLVFSKGNVLIPNADRIEAYQNLTLPEKYVFLLETAWCYLDWSVIDGDGRSGLGADWFGSGLRQLLQNPVGQAMRFLQRGWMQSNDPTVYNASAMMNSYMRVGHWFGWYDIREMPQPTRNRFELDIDQVTLTAWGQQCLPVLIAHPFGYWNENTTYLSILHTDDIADEPIDRATFAGVFRSLLGEPMLLSLYPINSDAAKGVFWFQVELLRHKVSRTIAMSVKLTLEDLHQMIQSAFSFDNDHLYEFYFNVRNPYNGKRYSDPRSEGFADSPPADGIALADLNLYEGQRLLYVFDFGDRWTFQITVARHLPNAPATDPAIVARKGESPAQYPDYDDDEA